MYIDFFWSISTINFTHTPPPTPPKKSFPINF
jgi:hypothetical protein